MQHLRTSSRLGMDLYVCVYVCINLPIHSATAALTSSCFTLIARWHFGVQLQSGTICDTVVKKKKHYTDASENKNSGKLLWTAHLNRTHQASGECSYVFTLPLMSFATSTLTASSEGSPVNEVNLKSQGIVNCSLESSSLAKTNKNQCLKTLYLWWHFTFYCTPEKEAKLEYKRILTSQTISTLLSL